MEHVYDRTRLNKKQDFIIHRRLVSATIFLRNDFYEEILHVYPFCFMLHYCIIQHYVALPHYTVLCCITELYCTIPHCAALSCTTALYRMVLYYCIMLNYCCFILHFTPLHSCNTLHYTALRYIRIHKSYHTT